MMSVETETDLNAACDALKQWFISQDLKPHESILVIEHFVALMIVDNVKNGGTSIMHKLECHVKRILSSIKRDLTR